MELANSEGTTECISQPVHETGLCKNLLQEYAQKMNYAIPAYECHKDEKTAGRVPLFSCTIEIGGITYIGAAARTKKEAELKAARTALLAIQSTGSNEKSSGNSGYTVIPCKKRVTDFSVNLQETVAALKPKKSHFKKKPQKKRHSGPGGYHAQRGNMGSLDVNGDSEARPEVGKTDAFGVQVTDSVFSPMEATKNFQDERSFNGDIDDVLVPYKNGDAKDVHLKALNFSPIEVGTNNPGINSMISGGDLTCLVKEVNKIPGVGQVASIVNNSTMGQGEVPSGINGLNERAYGTDAGQTKERIMEA
ncbi:unnamed protein product [Ilex paraguariensis]|uniref:DRBM domain-containing protein n=1 Tax=Ilex paraguariensis TaxID=185542 RepID=A0ABC8T822_9AQUA